MQRQLHYSESSIPESDVSAEAVTALCGSLVFVWSATQVTEPGAVGFGQATITDTTRRSTPKKTQRDGTREPEITEGPDENRQSLIFALRVTCNHTYLTLMAQALQQTARRPRDALKSGQLRLGLHWLVGLLVHIDGALIHPCCLLPWLNSCLI